MLCRPDLPAGCDCSQHYWIASTYQYALLTRRIRCAQLRFTGRESAQLYVARHEQLHVDQSGSALRNERAGWPGMASARSKDHSAPPTVHQRCDELLRKYRPLMSLADETQAIDAG